MLDFLFVSGQVLCLSGCLYGAYLCIRHSDTFKSPEGQKHQRVARDPEADELLRRITYLGYYT